MLRKPYWRVRYFKCPVCGVVVTATKTDGSSYTGHIKTMYCYKCKVDRDYIQFDSDKAR